MSAVTTKLRSTLWVQCGTCSYLLHTGKHESSSFRGGTPSVAAMECGLIKVVCLPYFQRHGRHACRTIEQMGDCAIFPAYRAKPSVRVETDAACGVDQWDHQQRQRPRLWMGTGSGPSVEHHCTGKPSNARQCGNRYFWQILKTGYLGPHLIQIESLTNARF